MALALALSAFLLLASGGTTIAVDAPGIAQIKKLTGQVTILRAGGRLPAKMGDSLFEEDGLHTVGEQAPPGDADSLVGAGATTTVQAGLPASRK